MPHLSKQKLLPLSILMSDTIQMWECHFWLRSAWFKTAGFDEVVTREYAAVKTVLLTGCCQVDVPPWLILMFPWSWFLSLRYRTETHLVDMNADFFFINTSYNDIAIKLRYLRSLSNLARAAHKFRISKYLVLFALTEPHWHLPFRYGTRPRWHDLFC